MQAPGAEPAESVRLAVGRFPDSVVIIGAGMSAVGVEGAIPTPRDTLRLEATRSGIRVDGRALRGDIIVVRAPGTLSLRGHRYHQELEVRFRTYDGKPELLVVHPLDLETYVVGIVSSELPRGWPLETYKAQAVAARTFAMWQKYRRLDLPYHMETSVLDQVYGGVDREHALAHQAARETRGMVLTSGRRLAQAYFHASCGDHTESAREGWGMSLPYLPGSPCRRCTQAHRYQWKVNIPRADVDRAFRRLLGEPVQDIQITARTHTGRVKTAVVKGKTKAKTVSGGDLRRLIGYGKLYSTWIGELRLRGDVLTVRGKGSGHGVGMCQWGARGHALDGKSFLEILALYYPNAPVRRMY